MPENNGGQLSPSFNDDERLHLEAALLMYAKFCARETSHGPFIRAMDLFFLVSRAGSATPELSQIPRVWLDYHQARTRGEEVEPPTPAPSYNKPLKTRS